VCALHCAQLLHTILHRTDLIVFPLTLQTITTAPMMSIWGKGITVVRTGLDISRLSTQTVLQLMCSTWHCAHQCNCKFLKQINEWIFFSYLEVIWKFWSASVAGVHCDADVAVVVQHQFGSFEREHTQAALHGTYDAQNLPRNIHEYTMFRKKVIVCFSTYLSRFLDKFYETFRECLYMNTSTEHGLIWKQLLKVLSALT